MRIPLVDLKAQYEAIKGEIAPALHRVLDSAVFTSGPSVEAFEREFARFCGADHAAGVASGTDALLLIMRALGIGPGDEVITVASTFAATVEAIHLCGARPVFVDIDGETYTMDPSKLESAITKKTRAILPVHLFGNVADIDAIAEIAARFRVPVIEDACQAHGALHRGRPAGSLGTAAAFSFYPGKNLGAYGEAGAVTTGSRKIAERVRMLRDHGQARKYHHELSGWNARMDEIQAAVLGVKLRHLAEWNRLRRSRAELYGQLLGAYPEIAAPREAGYGTHAWHLYVVRVRERNAVLRLLHDQGIGCGVHYPIPVHLQRAYADLGYPIGSFPVAERCADEFLSLPLYPELSDAQVHEVSAALAAAVRKTANAAA